MSSSQIPLLSRRTLQEIRNGSLALMDISGSEKTFACSRMYVRVIRGIRASLSLLVFVFSSSECFSLGSQVILSQKTQHYQFLLDQDSEPTWKQAKADVASSLNITIFISDCNKSVHSQNPSNIKIKTSYLLAPYCLRGLALTSKIVRR